jgi:hypothetical protein
MNSGPLLKGWEKLTVPGQVERSNKDEYLNAGFSGGNARLRSLATDRSVAG